MKKHLLLIISVVISNFCFSQSPQSFNYQTVIRDASWAPVINQTVGIQISILESTANGQIVYQEEHNSTTSQIGLVNLIIGEGSVTQGVFDSVNWGQNNHFIQIGVDFSGGNSFDIIGTSQLRSVPYALYAEKSNTPGPQGPAGNDGINGVDGESGFDGNSSLWKSNGAISSATIPGGKFRLFSSVSATYDYALTIHEKDVDSNNLNAWLGFASAGDIITIRAKNSPPDNVAYFKIITPFQNPINSSTGLPISDNWIAHLLLIDSNPNPPIFALNSECYIGYTVSGPTGATGPSFFSKMEGGKVDVGSETGLGIKIIPVTFSSPFTNPPLVICTASAQPGTIFDDSFNITTRSVTTTGFEMIINRVDSQSWSQDLDAHWMAFE